MKLPETSPPFRRDGFPAGPTYELQIRGQVLVYSGRVLRFFRADVSSGGDWQWHVDHVAVEVKPKRNGDFSLRVGMARDGGVWSPVTVVVPPEHMPDVEAFFEILKKERSKDL